MLNPMGLKKDREGTWTRIEPVDGRNEDARSERSLRARRSDEEIGVAVSGDGSQDGIWQTTTITHEVEEREHQRDRRGKR